MLTIAALTVTYIILPRDKTTDTDTAVRMHKTHRLQMSISGPYVRPTTYSSGAAYSGDPQRVRNGSSAL